MRPRVAIIGGTGVGDLLLSKGGMPLHVPTAAGTLRGQVVKVGETPILLVSRHSAGHKVPPHRVNYAAMALGLKQLGIRWCLASAAVGGLKEHWHTGSLVVCSDIVDLSFRSATLFERTVTHTDFSHPFSAKARQALFLAGVRLDVQLHPEGIYVNLNGPRYETPYEIKLLSTVGDVIGMTAATEAICMREAGIEYATLAVVTNFAAGITVDPLNHEEVVEEMQRAGQSVVGVLTEAAKDLSNEP